MAEEQKETITGKLAEVYQYALVESVPYAFFKPDKTRDISVHLVGKIYRCEKTGKELRVRYKNESGVTYFSKGKLAQQRRIYDALGEDFPNMGRIASYEEFWNYAKGLSNECAEEVLQETEEGRTIFEMEELHRADEALMKDAAKAMDARVKAWCSSAEGTEILASCEDADFSFFHELCCGVILTELAPLEALLSAYREKTRTLFQSIDTHLKQLPEKFTAYAPYPVKDYESMSDTLYHEYTVAFPVDETPAVSFYIEREIEKRRVQMFLVQRRVETVEDLLLSVGVQSAWLRQLQDRAKELRAR